MEALLNDHIYKGVRGYMNHQLDIRGLLKGIAIWEVVLFLPAILLFSYLPDERLIDIFINVFIFFCCTIGLFTILRYVQRFVKKDEQT
ncbi:DUF6007 family protein [Guptibacillus hwajinpoensis]|uniref:DUF6007 family protein n=2 Tax=Guptibacillus hwajinpoensis TaxID=208199 RepID=UPI003D0570CB